MISFWNIKHIKILHTYIKYLKYFFMLKIGYISKFLYEIKFSFTNWSTAYTSKEKLFRCLKKLKLTGIMFYFSAITIKYWRKLQTLTSSEVWPEYDRAVVFKVCESIRGGKLKPKFMFIRGINIQMSKNLSNMSDYWLF